MFLDKLFTINKRAHQVASIMYQKKKKTHIKALHYEI